ncbi:MAG: hypothetical protein AAB740_02405 [Patescibacteria group bacterium]
MIKILALNGEKNFSLLIQGGFDVFSESSLGNNDGFRAPEPLLVKIKEVTEKKGAYDYIIIQNNMGIGVDKANAVAQEMRSKVIVVWNSKPTDSDTRPYRELKIKHFTDSFNFRKCLDELIKGR